MIPIDFVFFDAGGGHRSAATALKKVASDRFPEWEIRMVQLQDVLDPIDIFRRVFHVRMEELYNHLLRKGWTLGSSQILPLMHALIRLYQGPCVRALQKYWDQRRPKLVVSLIPNFDRALYLSLRNALPETPLVTILTDLADYPPHFWIEQQPQYFICGTAKAVEQARGMGHPPERIFRTSGMILRPEFYTPRTLDVPQERRRLGLQPERATGLVLFGGFGSDRMKEIGLRVARTGRSVQLILLCGRNDKLRQELLQTDFGIPAHVEGFTSEVPRFMEISDFLIGKPGPGSISEAIAMDLPVIVQRNSWTLPQERFNADWIVEKGVGIVVKNFREIDDAVGQLLSANHLAEYRMRASAIENRAVFEIPEILNNLLEQTGAALVAAPDSAVLEP